MAMPAETSRKVVQGRTKPRLSPPLPARSDVKKLAATADDLKRPLFPWQQLVGRYLYALGAQDQWLYQEVAAIVARQQGKTELLIPHIVTRLGMGRRMLHAAQNRDLVRLTFARAASIIEGKYPKAKVRRGAGQETIELPNGALYRITSATSGGPRGMSVDDLIVDEVREIDEDFVQAAEPTTSASANPQTLWLSNAGSDASAVLNSIRARCQEDPALAYLEWSAAPERAADDMAGWLEANPAIGHIPGTLASLERAYRSHKLAGTMASFETERLCRWVSTMRERLIDEYSWVRCKGEVGRPSRPILGVSMDPKGRRASVALAWRQGEAVALRLLLNVTGDPVNTDELGREVKRLAQVHAAKQVGFDPLTDKELAKYVKTGKPVSGGEFANASAQFANIVAAQKLVWSDCDPVTDDLTWTASKPNGEGSYHAVRALDDRPITASLAAIRAVWLASGPPVPVARVY
jgi:hypothetical protein